MKFKTYYKNYRNYKNTKRKLFERKDDSSLKDYILEFIDDISDEELQTLVKNIDFDGFSYYDNIYDCAVELSSSFGTEELLVKVIHTYGPKNPDQPCYYKWVKYQDGLIFGCPKGIKSFTRNELIDIVKRYDVIKAKNNIPSKLLQSRIIKKFM